MLDHKNSVTLLFQKSNEFHQFVGLWRKYSMPVAWGSGASIIRIPIINL